MWLPICCSGLSTNSSSTAESIPVTCPITPHLFLSNSHLNTLLKHTMPFRLIAMPELCGSSIFQVCICYLWVSLWTHWPSALHVAESRCSSQQHREESNDSQKKLREFVSVAHIFILPFENSTFVSVCWYFREGSLSLCPNLLYSPPPTGRAFWYPYCCLDFRDHLLSDPWTMSALCWIPWASWVAHMLSVKLQITVPWAEVPPCSLMTCITPKYLILAHCEL